MNMRSPVLLVAVAAIAACQTTPNSHVAGPGSGRDPIAAADERARERMDTELAAYIARARATFPDVKRRYQEGLPAGFALFVTARVRDEYGNIKDAFIAVDLLTDEKIRGRIASETGFLTGYRKGQRYSFPESELIDWMITGPSGTTEGNFVGQFLDSQRTKAP